MNFGKNIYCVALLLFLPSIPCLAQKKKNLKYTTSPYFRVMWYNTENFYDTYDDPLTDDNEFLPGSQRHWTIKRYKSKIENIYKVIISDNPQPPVLIGLAEVENKKVLDDLIENTPLIKFNYHFVHYDSPDLRGIDVALLYRPDLFKPIKNNLIRVHFPFDAKRKTRDILYVKGIMGNSDTLHVFVNHWPSRRGGENKSAPYRMYVAQLLKSKTDSVFHSYPDSKILIIGDFNDEPDDESIVDGLKALVYNGKTERSKLYDLSSPWLKNITSAGTSKYKGKWSVIDQIIVSSALVDKKNKGLKCLPTSAKIDTSQYLLKDDNTYSGKIPFRTYNGYKYIGGFSDHLPIYLDLGIK
jgi:predicted extracellular nuclease